MGKQSSNVICIHGKSIELPLADNTPEALAIYRAANERFREVRWPAPFDKTTHQVRIGDARDLSWLSDRSVHLVVTSPPYWTLKTYPHREGQLGSVESYQSFLTNSIKLGASASASWCLEGGSVASWAMSAFRAAGWVVT